MSWDLPPERRETVTLRCTVNGRAVEREVDRGDALSARGTCCLDDHRGGAG